MNQENILGERIKELRTEQKLSQDNLAKEIQVSRLTIGKYERGERVPDAITLNILSHIFNVSTDYLLGNSSCRKIDNIEINKKLGISDKAIENILTLNEDCFYIKAFNYFIEQLEFKEGDENKKNFNIFFNILFNYNIINTNINIKEYEYFLKMKDVPPEIKIYIEECKKYGCDNILMAQALNICEKAIENMRKDFKKT